MCRPMWPFLLMYGSHNRRYIGFRRLTVVNETPRDLRRHKIFLFFLKKKKHF